MRRKHPLTNPGRRPGHTTLTGLALLVVGGIGLAGVGRLRTLEVVAITPESPESPDTPFGLLAASLTSVSELDPAKVQGAESCGECHDPELGAWRQSTHFATFKKMHQQDRAKEIADKMGLKGGIKRNDTCYNCHYTAQIVDGKRKVVSGVSCESCHGAGRDWTSDALHHETVATAASDGEKEMIRQKCAKAGMLRPANVYLVAKNCYSCHTVPNEKLVNVGGHTAGSDFELVSWSQGEVRHNYQHSPDGKNRPANDARKRELYVVGVMTDVEFSMRGLALITEKGDYRKAMRDRLKRGLMKAHAITAAVDLPELAAVLPPADKTLKRAELVSTADRISKATEDFAATADGANLADVDALIPPPSSYRGSAQP